ncbi:MAG: hypothetical protein U0L23_03590 [Lachnospiraceae bacterium]|nr:hypothetical protein [Lachnospiraceae bacterium]
MKKNMYTSQDFEVFKGNVYVRIQENGPLDFISKILVSNVIEEYWNDQNTLYAIYLLAMVDYLSKMNGVPLYSKYDYMRKYKLKDRIYPLSITISAKIDNKSEEEYIDDAIPEFLKYNIVEGDIFNVK